MNSMLQDDGSYSSVTCNNSSRVQSKRTPYFSSWLPNLFSDTLSWRTRWNVQQFAQKFWYLTAACVWSCSLDCLSGCMCVIVFTRLSQWLHVCDHVHLTVSVAVTLHVQHSQYNSVCSSPVMWNKALSYKGTHLRSSFSWISHNMKYVFQFTFPALNSFCKHAISATYTAHSMDIRL